MINTGDTSIGYVGLFTQPFATERYGTCMYGMGNAGNGELSLVLLTPGNFMDAYTMAKFMTWQDIHIFPSQLDPLFLSDVYRLFMILRPMKNSVTIHYPIKPRFSEDFEYDDVFLQNFDTNPCFISKYHKCDRVEFLTDITKDCLTFGITVTHCRHNVTIVPYLDESMYYHGLNIEDLNKDNQLHIPYNKGFYGGLSWKDMYDAGKKYDMRYIVPYIFDNWEEFDLAEKHSKFMPRRWGWNINDCII